MVTSEEVAKYPYYLSVVHAISEWDIGFQVDNDGEVEDDETNHQMFVDSKSRAAQLTGRDI